MDLGVYCDKLVSRDLGSVLLWYSSTAFAIICLRLTSGYRISPQHVQYARLSSWFYSWCMALLLPVEPLSGGYEANGSQ